MEPKKFLCPTCFFPLEPEGKESDITYREDDRSIVIRLGCTRCNGEVFLAVPLGGNFVVQTGGREYRSKSPQDR